MRGVGDGRRGRIRTTVLAVVVLGAAGCSSAGGSAGSGADSSFLSALHDAAPDVNTYRTDVQLTRLGHAACDGFRGGASYQQLADRMALLEGHNPLPSADLGAVITAAVGAYCPQYQARVS